MPSEKQKEAAAFIGEHRVAQQAFNSLPDGTNPESFDDAYDIQWAVHDWFSQQGEEYGGWKVGVTSTTMQAYMKMTTPSMGRVRRNLVARNHGDLDRSQYCSPGIELEIVVRLGKDIEPRAEPWTRQDLEGHIAALMPGFEVVDDRYMGILDMPAITLVADDFCNAGCVLGDEVNDWQNLDLEAIEGTMVVNGTETSVGHGRDVLGHPLEALAFVANTMGGYGKTLKAGEFIMLGSLVKTAWLDKGESATGEIKGLGRVSLAFG
ncbi:MAG: sulfate adenylyltransferase [Alphaproteobacteria bacterium]|jgi:2-keto-4-pentenoate hydratase|nr:sulfate adenylyltransferase [Alphaproteobacteria bacterium]MBT4019529.1 sulfate adenylyltransferase [Alphaproteobacteria bacterium]MBT4965661.1 sulfate adenylyltransferase [Alphaproteobacteria bacterium]MBT5158906.1 sulfate adenylyltransferase [Alphaproteobacteria bacterium]MBT5920453.1 sulfate adenylyltransferase [Alphaproteobacteria bacterium]